MTDERRATAPRGVAPTPDQPASGDGAPGRAGDGPSERAGREPGELVLGLSPPQIIGGFALLAGLIVLFRRRRRRQG